LHKQNLHKHAEVQQKNQIKTNYKNTEELVRKMVNVPKEEEDNKKKRDLSKKKEPALMRPGVDGA